MLPDCPGQRQPLFTVARMIKTTRVARRYVAADGDHGVALAFQRRPDLLEACWVPLAMDRLSLFVGDGNADHIRVLHSAVRAGE